VFSLNAGTSHTHRGTCPYRGFFRLGGICHPICAISTTYDGPSPFERHLTLLLELPPHGGLSLFAAISHSLGRNSPLLWGLHLLNELLSLFDVTFQIPVGFSSSVAEKRTNTISIRKRELRSTSGRTDQNILNEVQRMRYLFDITTSKPTLSIQNTQHQPTFALFCG
jgi:hypothetical protein